MRTQTIAIYKFSELSDQAKENALNKWREHGLNYDWWDYSLEDIKTALELIGFYDVKVYFHLGYSQSDYAAICGSYRYEKGALAKVKKDYPEWHDLHLFCKQLQEIQKRNFYQLCVNFSQYGRDGYSKVSDCYRLDTDYNGIADNTEMDLNEVIYSFNQDIYYMIRKEYEYLTSDEVIAETIECNDYEFYEDGGIV